MDGATTCKQEPVSQILQEKRNWIDAKISKPEPGQQVVIRIVNPTIVWASTDTEILYAEDMKIAHFAHDHDNPNKGTWYIDPPFPRYDYSVVSDKERIFDECHVTHWAIPEDGEIEGWNSRFEQINLFKTLKLEVDQEHEKDVYRALLYGAAYIQKANPHDPDCQRLATILYDLQYVLDTRKNIDLTDEEYEALVKERASKSEDEESKEDEPVDNGE